MWVQPVGLRSSGEGCEAVSIPGLTLLGGVGGGVGPCLFPQIHPTWHAKEEITTSLQLSYLKQ